MSGVPASASAPFEENHAVNTGGCKELKKPPKRT
jgi:hypothetical protein